MVGRSLTSRDDLILSALPLVRKIAAGFAKGHPSRRGHAPDLYSAGIEGLLDAAIRFDPEMASRFEAYAQNRIRGQIKDYIRSQDHLSPYDRAKANRTGVEPWRAPRSIESTPGMAARLRDHAAADPLEVVARREMLHKIEKAVRRLPENHRRALRLRYRDELTLAQVGQAMGFTGTRAYQVLGEAHLEIRGIIARKAARKLQRALRSSREAQGTPGT